jgi:hypothetical protein
VKADEVPFSNIHAVIIEKLKERQMRRFEVQTIRKATSICGNFMNQVPQYFVDTRCRSLNSSMLKIPVKGQSSGSGNPNRCKITGCFFAICKNTHSLAAKILAICEEITHPAIILRI